jgi:hypothetical protein
MIYHPESCGVEFQCRVSGFASGCRVPESRPNLIFPVGKRVARPWTRPTGAAPQDDDLRQVKSVSIPFGNIFSIMSATRKIGNAEFAGGPGYAFLCVHSHQC